LKSGLTADTPYLRQGTGARGPVVIEACRSTLGIKLLPAVGRGCCHVDGTSPAGKVAADVTVEEKRVQERSSVPATSSEG
jgi:hypothetical protein